MHTDASHSFWRTVLAIPDERVPKLFGYEEQQSLSRGTAKKIACVNEFRVVNKKQTEKISLLVSAGLCNSALGFQNNRLPNSQIKASSSYPGLYPYRARLRQNSAWCARYNNHNQYLRIDLRRVTMVTGIATQGRHNVNYWVTQYWLLYSQDNVHWALYRQMSNDKVSHYSHKIENWWYSKIIAWKFDITTDEFL